MKILMLLALLSPMLRYAYGDPIGYNAIQKEFKPLVDEFIKVSQGHVTKDDFYNIHFQFDDIEGTVVGLCYPYPWLKEIIIDRRWWNKWSRSDEQREEVLFHEIGHCLLRRGHTDSSEVTDLFSWLENIFIKLGLTEKKGFLVDGCPASIMHPYTIDTFCYRKHRDFYIDELFDYIEDEEIVEETTWKVYREGEKKWILDN